MSDSKMIIPCVLSTYEGSPYDEVKSETRTAKITSTNGDVIFEQKDIEAPAIWSQNAVNIVANKYFHGKPGADNRETGVKSMIERVVSTITESGMNQGYFDQENADMFHRELVHIILNQMASFNSPVWFNVGCHKLSPGSKASNWHWDSLSSEVKYGQVGYSRPQASACFLLSVEDSMESIMDLAKAEAMIFKCGGGAGSNLSPLRSSNERLSAGGMSSGPISFMKGYDAFAGVLKSGGVTRRAAKLTCLNMDHPDIEEFIHCKGREEAKAHALMKEGYDGSHPDSEAYGSVFFQNSNISIRVSDSFMKACEEDKPWDLVSVVDKKVVKTLRAKHLLRTAAESAWKCGDPGIQFDDTINRWNTTPSSGRINTTNPCGEVSYLDDIACNLASINLLKFLKEEGKFAIPKFRHVVNILIIAQDILVDLSGYPTEKIARNSHDYRPLGLGYANLGALLMAMGVPYDSEEGQNIAAGITSLMTAQAYLTSGNMARDLEPLPSADTRLPTTTQPTGSFPGFFKNRGHVVKVVGQHWKANQDILNKGPMNPLGASWVPLFIAADGVWAEAHNRGDNYGYRNGQLSVLAPTGTISFMMDCDTTGVEPELALVKNKKLVGGGQMKIVNQSVGRALEALGYDSATEDRILEYIHLNGHAVGSELMDKHLPVFDCSFQPPGASRSIHYMGHVKMVAAVQPFLSGSVSKTVNMPENATVEDIEDVYLQSWKMGLKSVTVYRDGSKKAQPLVTSSSQPKVEDTLAKAATLTPEVDTDSPPRSIRHKLPDERRSVIHKYSIAGHEGYLIIGLYPNGEPGEIFIKSSKEGSTISGLMDSWAIAISLGLQHGVPLKLLVDKFSHMRFEPSGFTRNPDVHHAKSLMDYIARFLDARFIKGQQQTLFDLPKSPSDDHNDEEHTNEDPGYDAPACPVCGTIMSRSGSCYRCTSCGSTSGCS